jgi:hypothetical protein
VAKFEDVGEAGVAAVEVGELCADHENIFVNRHGNSKIILDSRFWR